MLPTDNKEDAPLDFAAFHFCISAGKNEPKHLGVIVLVLSAVKVAVRNEAPGLKTEDITACCLV